VLRIAGVRWLVREAEHSAFDRRATRSLIFESHDVVRRVREYPADWYALSDEVLYQLSLGKLG
jgi:hypothetical protein